MRDDIVISNRSIYWKFKEPFRHWSYHSLYLIDWLSDVDSRCRRDRLSWNAMYFMEEGDKLTINGYYDMGINHKV